MATGKTARFEDLIKLATDFVTMTKGSWDHTAWLEFISKVRAQGFDTSEDMQMNLGKMTEAMKQFYMAAATVEPLGNAVETVIDDSLAFVKQHQGIWDHSDWENFVTTVGKNTFTLSEGTVAYLGGLLESIRILYTTSPAADQRQPAATHTEIQPASTAEDTTEMMPAAAQALKQTETEPRPKPAPEALKRWDDLTAINGIGPAFARKLNGVGISSYAQLAALSDDDIQRLEKETIRFAGRIRRDDWVGQAKVLSPNP